MTEGEIYIINTLKNRNGSQVDNITTIFVKNIKPVKLLPLTKITNSILRMGIFPHSLKISKINPTF